MKVLCAITTMLISSVCLGAEETMLLQLVETTVDMTAAQRQVAVFTSNEDAPRTFYIPLWSSSDNAGKNEKNIVMLIRQFPKHAAVHTDSGRTFKPRGTLNFLVPREDPSKKVGEWELVQLSIQESAEPQGGGYSPPAARTSKPTP